MAECFRTVSEDPDCRVVVLSGNGKHFTSGIDLMNMLSGEFSQVVTGDGLDIARKFRIVQRILKNYQASFSSLEECNKPVIAAVHGACIGAGLDLITAVDVRYCSQDAFFQLKEVDIGDFIVVFSV